MLALLFFFFSTDLMAVEKLKNQMGNQKISHFRMAKQKIKNVFSDDQKTLYCGCRYQKKKILWESCGYRPKKDVERAKRMEWEHVVPAHSFGQSFKEWREGHPRCVKKKRKKFYKGRKCARKVSALFRKMEGDLYNLYPSVGEVNAFRSNFRMAMIPGEKREFGQCDVEIHDRKIEPRPEIRGDIARIYFYMDKAYPGRGIIGRKAQKLFLKWHKEDPVSIEECQRAKRIEKIQGNRNFILYPLCESLGAKRSI